MKDTKYILIDSYLYDYFYIEEKLTKLAAAGWHPQKLGPLVWKFRRGEPKAVRYAVTFAPSASAFNSRPTEAEEDLTDLCAQAGWVRVANHAQLHIYRNEDPNATPLETDEAERLKNIRRTMKKHFFPQQALMVVLFLLQAAMHTGNMLRWPTRTLSTPLVVSTLTMLPLISLVYLILMFNGQHWLRKAQRAVDAGQAIPVNRFYRRFRWVLWAGLIAYLCSLFSMAGMPFVWAILSISAITIGCVYGTLSLLKYLNAPRWVNMAVPVVITSLVLMFLLTLFAMSMDRISMNEDPLHADTLPLTLSDLGNSESIERSVLEEHASPLAGYGHYWDEAAEERIIYTIVDIKCPLFYDMIQAEQEQQFLQSVHYMAEHEGIDSFDSAYVRHASGTPGDRWLICWDTRIVSLRASWILTPEQLDTIEEMLMP